MTAPAAAAAATGPVKAGRYSALDGLRFQSVFLVFVTHLVGGIATSYFHLPEAALQGSSRSWAVSAFAFFDGNQGVELLFLISGMLMARISRNDTSGWSGFVGKRLFRLYPAFAAAMLAATWISCTYGSLPFRWKDLLLNLVFWNALPGHGGIVGYNYVTWTMGYIFVFYMLVPLLAMLWRRAGALATAALIAIGVALLPEPFLRFSALPIGFIVGMIPVRHLDRAARRIPLGPLIAAIVTLMLAWHYRTLPYMHFYWMFLPLGALLIVGVAHGDGALTRFYSLPLLRELGRISYSFYLLHASVISLVLYEGLALTGVHRSPYIAVAFVALASFFGTVWLSQLWFRWFEAPYFKARARTLPESTVSQATPSG